MRTILSASIDQVVTLVPAVRYNSNKAHQNEAVEYEMVKTYEQILYDAKLDAMFAGHVHAYERSHRVFQGAVDKCGATYINIGALPTFYISCAAWWWWWWQWWQW